MKDKERMSRLLGAVLEECSGVELDGVRVHVLRAMNALDSTKKTKELERESPRIEPAPALTPNQSRKALADIQSMIDEEKSRLEGPRSDRSALLG